MIPTSSHTDVSSRKVMFVDDEPFLLDMYKMALTRSSFAFIGFANAEGDFEKRVLTEHPDVIVLDYILGSGARDGIQVLTELKKNFATASIPVFMLTNQVQKQDIVRAITSGAVDYLIAESLKPVDLPRILLSYLEHPKEYEPRYKKFL